MKTPDQENCTRLPGDHDDSKFENAHEPTFVERVWAEAALRASEEKYRTLFNSIDQGYAVAEVLYDKCGTPVDARFLETNRAFEKQMGLTNHVGQTAREMIPDFDDDWVKIYGQVAETGESVRFEKRSRGLGRWFNVFVSRVGGEGSRLVNIIKEDVTAQREADAALRESEERKAFLLKLADAQRPIADPIEIQGMASRLLGEQLRTDRTMYSEMNEELGYLLIERDYVREGVPSRAGRYPLADFEWLRLACKKGGPLVVNDATARSIPDVARAAVTAKGAHAFITVPLIKDDRVLGALTVSSLKPRAWTAEEVRLVQETAERTWAAVERARAETALRESEARFRHFLENVHEYALVQCNPDLRITSWNPGAERIFGYSSHEVLGQPFSLLLSPEDCAAGFPSVEISALERDGGRNEDERWLVRKDGRRIWTRGVTEAIRNKEGQVTGVTKVLRDETERLKTETSLRQSEKLAVVGRMASSIAHEINNPLEAVTNLIFLARRGEVSPEVADLLAQAERELARVSHIARATLHFHRHTTEPVEADIETILESVLLLHEGRLRVSHITTERRYRENPSITCQENEIRQLLANLVGNAIDAMAKNRDLRQLTVRVRGAVDSKTGEEGVRVMIADTGSGIQESAAKHIFEPFFTTKAATGTGLGLWISAQTVKKHQGTLRFRSRTGGPFRGTVFSLYLRSGDKEKRRESPQGQDLVAGTPTS